MTKIARKRIFKRLGTALTIFALIAVIKKLCSMDINYHQILEREMIIKIFGISLAFALHMFILCIPWKGFIEILTKRKIQFNDATWILNKANMLKYLPGNILQFVGRNELALLYDMNHMDVAFGTACDTLMLTGANILLAVSFNWQGVTTWFFKYKSTYTYMGLPLIALIALFFFASFKWRKAVLQFLTRLKVFLTPRSIFRVSLFLLFYMVISCFVAYLFLITLQYIEGSHIPFSNALKVLSAYSLSWVAGYLVIGSPGGLGIKEATLVLLLHNIAQPESALLAAVIFRFITIIGDFMALAFSFLFHKSFRLRMASNE